MSLDPNDPTNPANLQTSQGFPPAANAYPPAATGYAAPPGRDMKTTALVLGICFLIVAAFGVLVTLSMGMLLPVIMANARAQNPNVAALPAGFGTVVAVITGIFLGLLPLVAGVGLLTRAAWGRIFAIVVAILLLISLPFGTIFGGITLFFLLRGGSSEGYAALSQRTAPR